MLDHHTTPFTIIAQDPSISRNGRILTAPILIPAEPLAPGPTGHRVRIIDYDASTKRFYKPAPISNGDMFAQASDDELLGNPAFHAQNVYAIAMSTLARFEHALGRRLTWGFNWHQLTCAPHAFAAPNAFYSPDDGALLFGYVKKVFTCLSHDIIAHETAHALLDGLRRRYRDPSSADQEAFHEGFADIVALLSVFGQPSVVSSLLGSGEDGLLRARDVGFDKLKSTALLGLAEQFGKSQHIRSGALRRSLELEPDPARLSDAEFEEPHRRGEVLVAAVMHAFVGVWRKRLEALGQIKRGYLDRSRVVEEGAKAAERLLTICIRAIDYMPSIDLLLGDFLSALLTADEDLFPDDSMYGYRVVLREGFGAFGIRPASLNPAASGTWEPAPDGLRYGRVHFESMRRDPDEVFRFLWDNRDTLHLHDSGFTRVLSVRPSCRSGPDGFMLQETVAEYVQHLTVLASELTTFGIRKPDTMPDGHEVTLNGGGALIFDERGCLKYHVHNRLVGERQSDRLAYVWGRDGDDERQPFALAHRARMGASLQAEDWQP